MLSKFFVTVIVIGMAFFAISRRSAESKDNSQPKLPSPPAAKPEVTQLNKDLRAGAYLFAGFMLFIGAVLYYLDWQDDHTVLTVNLIRGNEIQPVTYEVYKYQLQDKSFVTTDGKTVSVASNERMEIEGLNN